MFTIPSPFFSTSEPAETAYLLDEFDGTGSMNAWAPAIGYDTGNWVNGFLGVLYFAERVSGLVKPIPPSFYGDITYGADPAATPVAAPIKVLFEFNTGLQVNASSGAPAILLQIRTATLDVVAEVACFNGVDFILRISYNGVSQDTEPVTPAWNTTYSGELVITNGNQTVTIMGKSCVSANAWSGDLTFVFARLSKDGGLGRIEILPYP